MVTSWSYGEVQALSLLEALYHIIRGSAPLSSPAPSIYPFLHSKLTTDSIILHTQLAVPVAKHYLFHPKFIHIHIRGHYLNKCTHVYKYVKVHKSNLLIAPNINARADQHQVLLLNFNFKFYSLSGSVKNDLWSVFYQLYQYFDVQFSFF